MHAYAMNPAGCITHIPLDGIIYRLELASTRNQIGVGIRYVSSGTTALAMLAAIQIDPPARVESTALEQALAKIAKIGLSRKTKKETINRFREAMQALYNVIDKDDIVDEALAGCSGLVDCYESAFQALIDGKPISGEFRGWWYLIAKDPHDWGSYRKLVCGGRPARWGYDTEKAEDEIEQGLEEEESANALSEVEDTDTDSEAGGDGEDVS